jgi:predicted dehydrogenase
LCGLGGLSESQIAPALLKTKHCRLAGLITGSPGKTQEWKARYDIPDRSIYSYDSMSEMADNPDIDVVYIVTPNALHGDQTIAAAKAGKHVFCEKPMEISEKRCRQMIDACKAADRKLGVGYRCQFDPLHLEMIRLAREKEFGDVRVIESSFGFNIGDPNQWRLKKDLSGGGALMDVGIYCVQASRYISGEEPVMVSAMETRTDPVKFREVDETITWQAKFPSGMVANCGTTFGAEGMNQVKARAERGWFGLEPAFGYGGNKGARSDGKQFEFRQIDTFAAQMDDFAQCILDDRESKVSGSEGMQDVKILMAIYESARTGRPVNIA